MNIQSQINKADNRQRHAQILAKIQSEFVNYFEQLLDDCCMRIDLDFGLQLAKNRERSGKEQHKKMLEYLRQTRKDLKQRYLLEVSDVFDKNRQKILCNRNDDLDLSGVSLADDELVEEEYTIAMIIRNCEHSFHEALHCFNKQLTLQVGMQALSDRQNPIAPERLVRALVEVVKPLKLNTDFRIALYKTFDLIVFSQLGFIYRELTRQIDNGSIAQQDQLAAISKGAEAVAGNLDLDYAVFQQLQQKLALWRSVHGPSGYDCIPCTGNANYESFEVKHALEILQQGYVRDQDEDIDKHNQSLKWQVVKQLSALDISDESKCLSGPDEDMLDLVSLIFAEIRHDATQPDSVKSALLQLQIPMAATCLGQYSVFVNKDNPIRLLIDNLGAAGAFLNNDDYGDHLVHERITGITKRLLNEHGSAFPVWITESDEFSRYLEKHKQRNQIIEERSLQLMQNKEALALSKKTVVSAMDNSMRGKELPAAITEFLREVWQDVLLVDYVRKEEEPGHWQASVQAMNELIISVLPPADENQRSQILKFLPSLIKALRSGLKRISYDKNAQSRFFKELAVWHIILMDKKEHKTSISAESKRNEPAIEAAEIRPEVLPGSSAKQISNLAENSWVAFELDSGRQWGKLVWRSEATGTMHFVGKNGIKMMEISAAELAEKFRQNQAALVELNDKTITERVLSNLMSL